MLGNDKNKNNNNFEYISLQDAVKFCNYSQEYLSLRARQGKLKSVKLGRNWVTTKEWLVEYAGKVEEYNDSINNNNNGHKKESAEKIVKEQIIHSPPENLPIFQYPKFRLDLGTLRSGFAAALVLVLMVAGGVFGKESLFKTYDDIAQSAEKIVRNMETVSDDVFTATINYKGALVLVSGTLSDYGQWLKEGYSAADKNIEQKIGKALLSLAPEKVGQWVEGTYRSISQNYSAADKNIEQKIGETLLSLRGTYSLVDRSTEQKFAVFAKDFADGYLITHNYLGQRIVKTPIVVGNFIKQKLVEAGQGIKNFGAGFKSETMRLVRSVGEPFVKMYQSVARAYKFVTSPWKEVVTKEESGGEVVVQRIEVSRVIEPVREVTRETIQQVTKIDDAALAEVRANMVYLEEEISKRLYAPGGVISQTIYVTEPVSSPKIYQENGDIVLQTIGSGNVILTAATGLQLYGKQVVIESTSLLNPLIYLAANTRIDGDATISGTTSIGGSLGVGGTFSSGEATISGDLTVAGNTSITGNLTIVGNETITGANLMVTASSTLADGAKLYFGTDNDISMRWSNTYPYVPDDTNVSGAFQIFGASTTIPILEYFVEPQGNLYGDVYGEWRFRQSNPYNAAMQAPMINLIQESTGESAIRFWRNGSSTAALMLGMPQSATDRHFMIGWDAQLNIMIADENGHVGLGGVGTEDHPAALLEVRGREDVLQMLVKGNSAQTENLFEIQNSASTTLMSVDVSGNVALTGALYQDIYSSDDGLVLYLPFSEGITSSSANITYDRSPYGNDGTATGMPMPNRNATSGESGWATTTDKCKVPGCMSFDGTNDYVNVADSSTLNITKAITLSGWIKLNTVSDQGGFINKATSGVNGWTTRQTVSGKLIFYAYIDGVLQNLGSSPDLSLSRWYYAVFTYDSVTGVSSIYIDGARVGGETLTGLTTYDLSTTSASLKIGYDSLNGVYTNGTIDEVRIYNRALSADEVRTHYLRGTNTNGAVLADKFRVIGTDNNVDFIIINGNVGIGTTTPAVKFVINSTDAAMMPVGTDAQRPVGATGMLRFNTDAVSFEGYNGTNWAGLGGVIDVDRDTYILAESSSGADEDSLFLYTSSTERMIINSSGRVGIGTTTLSGLLTVGTSTPALVVAPNGYVGIGTSTPKEALHVIGNALIEGDIVTVSGDILPHSPRTQDIGSDDYDWQNIYAYNVFANNLNAASSTIAGTSAETFTINSDATGDATSSLRFYRGTVTPHALLTWDADYDRFNFNFPLYLSGTGNLTSAGALTIQSTDTTTVTSTQSLILATAGEERLRIDTSGRVGIGTTTLSGLLTVGTSTPSLVVASNGYVGIGTTAPVGSRLEIAGGPGTGGIRVVGTDSGFATGQTSLVMDYDTASNIARLGQIRGAAGTAGSLILLTYSTERLRIDSLGNVGIATSTPRSKLDVWGNMAIGTSTAGNYGDNNGTTTPALYVLSGNGGQVGIGTTTLSGNLLTVGTTTPSLVVAPNGYVGIGTANPEYSLDIYNGVGNPAKIRIQSDNTVNSELLLRNAANEGWAIRKTGDDGTGDLSFHYQPGGAGELFRITKTGNVGIGTTAPSSKLTIAGAGSSTDFAIGDFSAVVLDSFESTLGWTSYKTTDVSAALNTSIVKVGTYSLNIGATTSSEDVYVAKDYASAQNWSAYEKMGFWIRASKMATSTATTTQIISAAIYGTSNNVTTTHQIYIQEANKWQYEEWNISGIQNSTSTNRLAFRIDVGGTSIINFYIDQIRLYDSDERTGEMFVDADGTLVMMGRGAVEIGRADGSSNKPGIKVDSAIVEFNQPIAVDVGGNVGIAYDLEFTNPDNGQILSNGSLTIEAGSYDRPHNLILKTRGTGDIITDIQNARDYTGGFKVLGDNGYILTVSDPNQVKIKEDAELVFGSLNQKVIDDFSSTTLNWRSYNPIYVGTSTATTTGTVKVGSQALKIYASTTPEDIYVARNYSSIQDWSAFERMGFWIKSDKLATSTATTTQMISIGIYGATNNVTTTHQISIQKENAWQYQEWNISGVQNATSVDRIFFRIDANNISTVNFYIDQIRLYDSDERAGEMFVDSEGTLVMMGRNSVELVAPQTGAGSLPGVKVGAAVVELGQPLSVNVGGDVGFDYDIQFLSTGLSQITSEGPLRIAAGDSNHSENLTLTTGGSGDVIVELTASSSAFMITHAWDASTTIPFIINSESNATNTAGIDKLGVLFQVISDYSTDENVVFTVDAAGSIKYDMTASTPAADVAENYYIQDESIKAGDVVCLTDTPLTVEKCSGSYASDLIGVVSTRPALLMADDLSISRPVALAGRVPVKISTENGPISIGDPLTSASSTPGTAMKATGIGKILGYALEPLEGDATSTEILVFMNLQELGGGNLTVFQNSDGDLEVKTLTQNGLATLFKLNEEGALVVDKIKTNQLCVGSVCVTENEFMKIFGAGVAQTLATSADAVCTNGANRPCSSEVGACRIGSEICEGGQWGSCIGAVFPTAELCDKVDNDCDGAVDEDGVCSGVCTPVTYFLDLDVDTYGNLLNATSTCEQPAGYVADSADCDDANTLINPGAAEICDSIDNNCNGEIDEGGVCPAP